MSDIDKNTIKHIAKLARIHLNEEEETIYATELNNIFDWIEKLRNVDTEGVEEMAGVGSYELRQRDDEVLDGEYAEDLLKNAPKKAFDCFLVPKVIE